MENQKLILKKVATIEEFRDLRDKWNSLLEQSPNPNIFLTWEWLFTWWEFYGDKYHLFILLALDQEEKIFGIAPLCLTHFSPLKLKTIKFLGTEEVCSDHLDFILQKGREEELLPLFLSYLENNPREWDLLDLTDFQEDSLSLSFIQTLAEKKGYRFSLDPWTVCPYVLLPQTWEGFLNQRSANARKDIRRQLRLFEEFKQAKYSFVKVKRDLIPAMEKLFYLHTKRWSTLGEEGVFQKKRFNQFHLSIAELFLERGWLFLSYLSDLDGIFCICYNYRYSDRLFGYQFGFDPDWKGFSPGTVLMAKTTESAISQRIREYDFLRGEAPYKHKWADNERKNLQLRVWNKNSKSTLCRGGLISMDKAKKLTKKYMPDFVIKILKYLWHLKGPRKGRGDL